MKLNRYKNEQRWESWKEQYFNTSPKGISKEDWKNYSIFLLYSNLFIILASFASLNRLNGNPIDFPLRIYLEHIIAGAGMPLVFAILSISVGVIFFNFTKKNETILLLFWTLLWLVFEVGWQFCKFYNIDSWLQMLSFILGIILLWYLYYSILLKKKMKR